MNKPGAETISDQLRRAIADCGVSMTRLSRAADIEDSAVSRFMRGERGLNTRTLDKLCLALGLELRKAERKDE